MDIEQSLDNIKEAVEPMRYERSRDLFLKDTEASFWLMMNSFLCVPYIEDLQTFFLILKRFENMMKHKVLTSAKKYDPAALIPNRRTQYFGLTLYAKRLSRRTACIVSDY